MRWAGLELDNGRLVNPPGGIAIAKVEVLGGAAEPVAVFELADTAPGPDGVLRTWEYLVPLSKVRRLFRVTEERST